MKAETAKSTAKRGAVLAKKRGMSAAAQKTATAKAKKAQLASPKGKKAGPTKGAKRVGKKVAVQIVKKKSTAGPTGGFNIRGAPKVPLGDLRGTLKMTISNRGTPGKGTLARPEVPRVLLGVGRFRVAP